MYWYGNRKNIEYWRVHSNLKYFVSCNCIKSKVRDFSVKSEFAGRKNLKIFSVKSSVRYF